MSKTDSQRSESASVNVDTRDRIRSVAGELYVLRGHDGFSFGDIAEAIGTTRANIHHHFGNKSRLMEELIEQFATDAVTRIEHLWGASQVSLSERLKLQLEEFRRFYLRFNPRPGDRNVWSPLSRLRLDLLVLGDPAADALARANRAYDRYITRALREAVEVGELSEATPVEDLSRVLRMLLLSCPPMTQDSSSFREIESLFGATSEILKCGWGRAPGE
jgi:AcrR family transcriptional regulator